MTFALHVCPYCYSPAVSGVHILNCEKKPNAVQLSIPSNIKQTPEVKRWLDDCEKTIEKELLDRFVDSLVFGTSPRTNMESLEDIRTLNGIRKRSQP